MVAKGLTGEEFPLSMQKYRDIYPKIFFSENFGFRFMQRWSEDIGFRNRNRCFTKKYVLLWWDLDRNRYFGRTN